MNAMSDLVFAKVISVCNCFVLFVYISWINKKFFFISFKKNLVKLIDFHVATISLV